MAARKAARPPQRYVTPQQRLENCLDNARTRARRDGITPLEAVERMLSELATEPPSAVRDFAEREWRRAVEHLNDPEPGDHV